MLCAQENEINKDWVSGREPTSDVIDRRKDANKLGLYNLEDDPGESKDLSQSHQRSSKA